MMMIYGEDVWRHDYDNSENINDSNGIDKDTDDDNDGHS